MGGAVIALTGNTEFNTATAKLVRAPCFIVRFGHAGGSDVQFSSAPVQNATYGTTKSLYMSVPSGIGSKVDFKKMSTTISGVSFTLADVDAYVTNFIEDANTASTPILNQGVTLLLGYTDIDESKFLTWVGFVDSYQWTGNGWAFTCRDPQRVAKQKIFKSNQTTLNGAINNSVTTVVLTDGTGFAASSYIRIDDEVILLGSKSTHTFSGCTRAQHSTTAAAHSDLDAVVERQVITGHPLDILRTTVWETELGLTSADYDDSEIQEIEDHWVPGWSFTFYLDDPKGVEAKKWCEEQIFQASGTFLKLKNSGILSVGIIRVPFPDETTLALTDNTLMDMNLSRVDRSMVNELQVSYDYNEITEKYLKQVLYIDADSITNHGKTNSMKINLKGVRSGSNGAVITARMVDRVFRMLATATPKITGSMSITKYLWEIGDVVDITHSFLPDLSDGTIGITNEQMVPASISPDFSGGEIKIELQHTGLTKGDGEYRRIAPPGTPDWGAASADEKAKYIFIGHFDIAPG